MTPDLRATLRLLLALVLLVVPGWCLWQALELLLTFFGDSPTAAEQQAAARWTVAAAAVALGASCGGLLLSSGRRLATCGFAVALALSCLLAALAAPSLDQVLPAPAVEGRTTCQEHSGGPSTCPGG